MQDYKNSRLDIKLIYHGRATHTYRVNLVKGEWPTESELISLCDGNDGTFHNDFGGKVEFQGVTATVDVYVD
jgi:hypothetical protein